MGLSISLSRNRVEGTRHAEINYRDRVRERIEQLIKRSTASAIYREQVGVGTPTDPRAGVYEYKIACPIGDTEYFVGKTRCWETLEHLDPSKFEYAMIVTCDSNGKPIVAKFKSESGFMEEVNLTKNGGDAAVRVLDSYLFHFETAIVAANYR